jgi:hypothetical protein
MADDEARLGGPSNMVAAGGLLANAVGVYERMLFENSFVNMLYTSFDRYDRNPYALPQRDSDGTIQRDIENQPYSQNLGLQSFIDPENPQDGILRGYESRDTTSGMLHALTENRATLAFAMSLFTGLDDSDYLRKNMVVKTREFEKQPVSQDEAEAAIRALSQQLGGQPNLTAEEIRSGLLQRNIAAGVFQPAEQMDAEAAARAARSGVAAMSVLDKDGNEILTHEGARATFVGLAKGTVKIGDLTLQGLYIEKETREAIQKEWMAELIQEGMDLGLDQTKATSRMKRLWYGPTSDPAVMGLGDLLWLKPEEGGIPYSRGITYNQLNTTYVQGPDGRPWATGFTRDGLMGALGLKPLKRAYVSEDLGTTGTDSRLNTTDFINGQNTGLRALELVDETRYVPTDVEIGKAIEAAIREAAAGDYVPYTPYKSSGGGYGGYGYRRYGYGGGGGGGRGGYSSGGYPNFQKMYGLPGGTWPYANGTPFVNTSNPVTRRADVRRERVWSERGRLKPWQ